jgi:replicative DNA helicase
MLTVSERDSSVDTVTLCQYLQDRKEIESVGGWAYISDLTNGLPTRPEIENYIQVVKDKAICRALISLADVMKSRACDSLPGLEIASWSTMELARIADENQTKRDVFDAGGVAEEAEYRLLDDPTPPHSALSTGIAKLDEMTGGGIRLGELWVIGASPSRGKTTLARQIVKSAALQGVGTYVHSGEMTKESWIDITACMLANIPAWKTREPNLFTFMERDDLRIALRQVAKMPLYISDAGGAHLDRLVWNATREVRNHQIRLMAVDYAQIIQAPGKDERQKVSNVANRMRLFAKEENVAVVLLSQSPRPEGRSINARPTMFSLKESGALEEAAHTVLLPYRPVDTETGAFTGEDELIIGKQRWGPIGGVPVTLNGKYLRFDAR